MNPYFTNIILRISVTVLLSSVSGEIPAQDMPFLKNATVFLVRHAEKDTGNNPALSDVGRNRSGYLVSALEGTSIEKVFVTQYRRTQQTADSIRIKTHVDSVHYNADVTGDAFIRSLQKNRVKNEKILVIGHSNTIPVLIGRLGITKPVSMRDDEYNTIYLIKYVKGEPMLFRKKFGDPTSQEANSAWEEVL